MTIRPKREISLDNGGRRSLIQQFQDQGLINKMTGRLRPHQVRAKSQYMKKKPAVKFQELDFGSHVTSKTLGF
jgi:hypothetical protein